MEINALNLIPAGRRDSAESGGRAFEKGFSKVKGLPDKLAPPGASPPSHRAKKALGGEGANLEPTAPTQTPDFSPKLEGKPPSHEFAPELGKEFDPEKRLAKPEPSAEAIAVLSSMGPIVVAQSDDETPDLQTAELRLPKDPDASGIKVGSAVEPPHLLLTMAVEDPRSKLSLSSAGGDVPLSGQTPIDEILHDPKLMKRPPKPDTPAERQLPVDPVLNVKSVESVPQELKPQIKRSEKELVERASKLTYSGTEPVPVGETKGKVLENWGEEQCIPQKELESKLPPNVRFADKPNDIDQAMTEEAPVPNPVKAKLESAESAIQTEKLETAVKIKASSEAPVDAAPADPKMATSTIQAMAESKTESSRPVIQAKLELGEKQTVSILRQVADRMEALAASHAQRKVTIRLEPDNLGTITLVVRQSKSEVEAEVYASHDSVRHALESQRMSLTANLEQRGIQLGSMTVGNELPQGSDRQEQAMRDAAQHLRHLSAARFEAAPTFSLEAMRNFSRKATGVDLWI